MSGYDKTFKVTDRDKDKSINWSFSTRVMRKNIKLEKYKDIWTKTGDLKNIALNVLQSMIIDM